MAADADAPRRLLPDELLRLTVGGDVLRHLELFKGFQVGALTSTSESRLRSSRVEIHSGRPPSVRMDHAGT